MPSYPNAKSSSITHHTVHPSTPSAHPTISGSDLRHCVFTDLSPATHIKSSTLSAVHLTSARGILLPPDDDLPTPLDSHIDHSTLRDTAVQDARVSRSEVRATRVGRGARLDRSEASRSAVEGARVERSTLRGSEVMGSRVVVERSQVADSTIVGGAGTAAGMEEEKESAGDEKGGNGKEREEEDGHGATNVQRSEIARSYVAGSRVERSTLVDCEVEGCRLVRTSMRGKVLRNGIWERGRLVGRVREDEEVRELSREVWEQMRQAGQVGSPAPSAGPHPPAEPARPLDPPPGYHPHPTADAPVEKHDEMASEKRAEKHVAAARDGYSAATGLTDDDRDAEHDEPSAGAPGMFAFFAERYEGPVAERPPPYTESEGVVGAGDGKR